MVKLAIVGSRSFDNYELLVEKIKELIPVPIKMIVSGGAKGADSLGERYAEENDIPTKIFKPNWGKYGRSAGFKRNIDIVMESDIVIAFWDGLSRGTKHSIDQSLRLGKQLYIVRYKE